MLMATMLLVSTNIWANPIEVSTWDDLKVAINDATEDVDIQVVANAELNYGTITAMSAGITVPKDITVNLDLNGATLTGTKNGDAKTVFLILNLGTLNISNGTLVNNSTSGSYNRLVANYSKMTAEGLNITVARGVCLMPYWNSDTELTNCNFVSNHAGNGRGNSNDNACIEYTYTKQDFDATAVSEYKLSINGGNYEGGWGGAIYCYYAQNVIIADGVFRNNDGGEAIVEVLLGRISIIGGQFNTNIERYLAQEYGYRMVSDMYVVEEITSANIHNISASNLEQLQAAALAPSTYERNIITVSGSITVDKVVNLARQNQIVVTGTLNVVNGGVLNNEGVITNNGTINCTGYIKDIFSIEGNELAIPENITINSTEKTINVSIQKGIDFNWMRYIVATTDGIENYWWTVNMENDITMPDAAFVAIPYFRGDFDGNGHSIRNLHIVNEGNSYYGMFVKMPEGSVKNVTFDNVDVINGGGYVGIIAGRFAPTAEQTRGIVFENITVSGSMVATGGTYGMGSLVGIPQVTNGQKVWFVNCVNNANITAAGGYNTGAFVGSFTGNNVKAGFYNCVNNGTISSNNTNNVYIGYGAGTAAGKGALATLDVIACKNTSADFVKNNKFKASNTNITYADPTKYVAVYDEGESKYIAREIGTISQPVSATSDWAQNTTWIDENSGNVVPTASDNVEISHNVVINNGTDAAAQGINFQTGGSLTVKDGGSLNIGNGGLDLTNGSIVVEGDAIVRVNGEVVNPDGQHIVIKSGEDGTAVFVVSPDYQMTNIPAEIQLYTTARKEGSEYIYNYIGIPTSTPITSATLDRAAVSGNTEDLTFRLSAWDVATGWHAGGWDDLSKPFRGVALTSESTQGTIFTFKGTLVGNNDGAMNFTRKGFNFFANSYTGPINIQTMLAGLSANVTATIYMYDSDRDQIRSVNSGDFAGYFTPAFTVIPSMQGFFIFTENKSAQTENIDYRQMVWNNTAANSPLHAPARQAESSFDRVCINVTSAAGKTDDVKLIGEETFSTQFDNGFDAVKYMNNGMNIYAVAENNLQNLYTDKLEGTFIGFAANANDEVYTLSFSNIAGEEYAIKDLYTGVVTPMTSTAIYTFTQTAGEDMSHRFQIIGRADAPTAVDNVEKAVAAEGIYTLTGMYIGTVDMWNALPQGVYVINGTKVVK